MTTSEGACELSSTEPLGQFECTFDKCDQVFDSVKAMKRHKIYDVEHDYCKKCDLDFESDLQHVIHRICTSEKHITCPMCGSDFKSKGGLDAHCEVMHPQKQHIKCLACQRVFPKICEMMQHIERNQCQITRDEWQTERAERALQKEAFMERRNPAIGSHLSNLSNDVSKYQDVVTLASHGQLLENEGPQEPISHQKNNDGVLAEVGELADRMTKVTTINDQKGEWLPKNGDGSVVTNDLSNVTYNSTTDANLSVHGKTSFKLIDFYCNIRKLYICAGEDCKRTFKDVNAFHKHLFSAAHIRRQVTCPSCLKQFNSVTALCAHMESPSRKCNIRHSINYNQVLREVSAGLIGTGGHHADGSVKYIMPSDEGWAA